MTSPRKGTSYGTSARLEKLGLLEKSRPKDRAIVHLARKWFVRKVFYREFMRTKPWAPCAATWLEQQSQRKEQQSQTYYER